MACRLYEYCDGPPLNCPITVCGGIHDSDLTREGLQAWEKHTVAGFETPPVSRSDHFYPITHQHLLLSVIANVLRLLTLVPIGESCLKNIPTRQG